MGLTAMMYLEILMMIVAHALVAATFFLNAFGVIDQSIPAQQMVDRGLTKAFAPPMMFAGGTVEVTAGTALAWGEFSDWQR
jgi:hypothetical protein